jgi:cytoskeletal protein CcmA (bactofilin family)
MAGDQVSPRTPIAGDLIAAARNLDVDVEVGGNALLAGGTVRVNAPVRESLFMAGAQVSLDAPVQRNARIAGSGIELGPRAHIAGNASLGGRDIHVLGVVDGYLQVGGRHVFLDGTVGGDTEIAGDEIELGPHARLHGKLRYASRTEIQRDPAAQIDGGTERLERREDWVPRRPAHGARWVWSIGVAIIAGVLAGLLPALYQRVIATVRSRWAASLLAGFLVLVAVPIAALMLLITLIGAPLAVAGMALYFALLVAGYASAGIAVGQLVLGRLASTHSARAGWRVGASVLGMLAISALGRVPAVGRWLVFAALLSGIGALVLQFGARALPSDGSGPPA